MSRKLTSLLLLLSFFAFAVPSATMAQNRREGSEYGGFIKRDKNGVKIGQSKITVFDGPGIVNYEFRHRWMPGPLGAATVIGTGAGAGAVAGGVVKGKKGAVYGAMIGAGSATALWLYKNRREKRRIF